MSNLCEVREQVFGKRELAKVLNAEKQEFSNQKAVLYASANDKEIKYPPIFNSGGIDILLQESIHFNAGSFTDIKMGIKFSIPYGYFLQFFLKKMLHIKHRLILSGGELVRNSFKREIIITIWNPSNAGVTLEEGTPLLSGYLSRMAFAVPKGVYEERFGKKINFTFVE